ncbi:MAG: ParB N-terminal domain-containing protein, partial [Pseudonocardia sp.]|nr:ParB N-terminal domain-containing protein [Pseudonocardia sp.]
MNTRKGGLGRGLAALIPTAPPDGAPGAAPPVYPLTTPGGREASIDHGVDQIGGTVAGASYRELATASIGPNPQQPRRQFDEEALAELTHSIKEFGLLQPIVVREVGPERYQLIMG